MTEHRPPSTYILRELIDIDVPVPVSWVPQTVGWKIVAALLFALLMWAGYRWINRWWNNRYRNEAIHELVRINLSSSLAEYHLFLVTKTVLRYLDSRLANAFGQQFLCALDDFGSSKTRPLSTELGVAWMDSLVTPNFELSLEQKQALVTELTLWIKHHQSGGDHVVS
ncbi:DUF4381 domain-containing protein [Vibrio sp. E150_011]